MAYSMAPITVTAALTLDRDVHAGTVVNVNNTTGFTITLPSATGKGDVYELFYIATIGSGSGVVQVTTTDIMQGVVHLTTDIAGTSMPTAATTDTITMNGTTTGGVKGTWLRFTDASSGIWKLEGGIVCTSTEATPFSAAVS
jgi:hypothetical protein